MATQIKIDASIHKKIDEVWEKYTNPKDILQWNAALDDWHTVSADNDLKENGTFSYRMEAKDKSFGFDFAGTYTKIEKEKEIQYVLEDSRNVKIRFAQINGHTVVTIKFDAEMENSVEKQRDGWQGILNRFKEYCEKENESEM